jgi:hypothetical protein
MICKSKGIETHGIYQLLTMLLISSQLAANPNTKKNMEAVVVASKKVGLEVNPDTITYKFMSCRRPNHKIKTANKFFESLMKFKLELNQQIKTAFTKKLRVD